MIKLFNDSHIVSVFLIDSRKLHALYKITHTKIYSVVIFNLHSFVVCTYIITKNIMLFFELFSMCKLKKKIVFYFEIYCVRVNTNSVIL